MTQGRLDGCEMLGLNVVRNPEKLKTWDQTKTEQHEGMFTEQKTITVLTTIEQNARFRK